jgi:curved DNA-binding protein CbpA
MKDYYRILGLPPSATLTEIKNTYRRQASALHPDRNPEASAQADFQALQEAYEVLSEPDRRLAYDENRRRSLIENPLETAREIWSAYLKAALR